jgi:hypothetical protein
VTWVSRMKRKPPISRLTDAYRKVRAERSRKAYLGWVEPLTAEQVMRKAVRRAGVKVV